MKISFEGAYDETANHVILYNPKVLPAACVSQVMRYGLIHAADKKAFLSGKLTGTRKAFTEMIQSYGIMVEVVPVTYAA